MIKVTYEVRDADGADKVISTFTIEFATRIEMREYERSQRGHPWLYLHKVKIEE